jgi:hypothetical protein
MTHNEIVEIAKQAGIETDWSFDFQLRLETFAKLVAQHEREKFCAVLRQLHDSYSLASDSNAIKDKLEAKDEPWEQFCDSHCVWTDHHPDCKLAQRTWVGLTDEEIQVAWNDVMDGAVFTRRNVYNAIEAKLKEKNNG